MFEVYRETAYSGQYRVVYFTELDEHNKEIEIARALAGDHYVDGYLRNYTKEEAKRIIDDLLERLNRGEQISPQRFLSQLDDYLA